MTYKEFIDSINHGEIKGINFFIKNYSHYNNCFIIREIDKSPSGNDIILIKVKLTNDLSEEVSFLNKFTEDYKIFHMGKKAYTLKQLWDKVIIRQVIK